MKPIMRAAAIAVAIAIAASATGHAQANAVVLLPGLDELNSDVGWWGYALGNTGFYSINTVSSLSSSSSIATQTSALNSFLSANGLGSAAVIVGHSQGGLVARYASRSTPVQGVVTVASPNAGAPIATEGALAYVGGTQAMIYLELFLVNEGWTADWGACDVCSRAWYDVSASFVDLGTLIATGLEVLYGVPFLQSNPHLFDLGPGTSVISSLSNYGLELAADREAVAVDVVDYAAAPFRLLTAEYADADALFLSLGASDLIFDGQDIYYAANDPGECYGDCGTLATVGNAMVTLGDVLGSVPVDVNFAVIGGIPNDGLVPTANEALPDKGPFRTLAYLTHVEVLYDNQGGDIVGTVNRAAGR